MMKRILNISFLCALMLVACENAIQGPEDEKNNGGTGNMRAMFSSIQTEVLSPTCALSGCHGGSQNPSLSAGKAYNNLVNKASSQDPSMLRVKPRDSNNSHLMKLLTGDGTSLMPVPPVNYVLVKYQLLR